MALKNNDIDQFCKFSEYEIEICENLVISILNQSSKKNKLNEFIKEAQKVVSLGDYRDVINWSFINEYIAMAETYLTMSEKIDDSKVQNIKDKITEMKDFLHFHELGSNFHEFFDQDVQKIIVKYDKFNTLLMRPIYEILDFLDD